MNVNIHITASRAVGAEFLRRKLRGVTAVIVTVSAILLGISIWLVSMSAWWWILLVVVISWALLGFVLLLAAWLVSRLLRPTMTKDQRKAVSAFVDKIERVSEMLQMTPFVVFFRILKDMIFPRDVPFIRQIADDSSSLHTDYAALLKLFS